MPIDYSLMMQAQPQAGTVQGMQGSQIAQSMQGPLAAIPGSAVTTQNAGGIADAMTSGAADPVATGNQNAGGWMDKMGGKAGASALLASIGSALSARDPNSWQHQLSGVVKQGAQQQLQQRGMLIAALQQKIGQTKNLSVPNKRYSIANSTNLSLLPAGGGL
jgi:hypothetical protein